MYELNPYVVNLNEYAWCSLSRKNALDAIQTNYEIGEIMCWHPKALYAARNLIPDERSI